MSLDSKIIHHVQEYFNLFLFSSYFSFVWLKKLLTSVHIFSRWPSRRQSHTLCQTLCRRRWSKTPRRSSHTLFHISPPQLCRIWNIKKARVGTISDLLTWSRISSRRWCWMQRYKHPRRPSRTQFRTCCRRPSRTWARTPDQQTQTRLPLYIAAICCSEKWR